MNGAQPYTNGFSGMCTLASQFMKIEAVATGKTNEKRFLSGMYIGFRASISRHRGLETQ